jgi:DNA-binding HxlR family transcriptional regulator
MNSNHIKELSDKAIPHELRHILRSLGTEFDWAIMSTVEQKEIALSELKKILRTEDDELLYNHLKKLSMNGLISHYYKNSNFVENDSYYAISKLGKKLITNINNVFNFDNKYNDAAEKKNAKL